MQTRTAVVQERTEHYLSSFAAVAQEKKLDLGARLQKAGRLVAEGKVRQVGAGLYEVTSSDESKVYHVNGQCDCPDSHSKAPMGRCKHRLAAKLFTLIEADLAALRDHGIPHVHRYVPCGQHTIPEVDCWQQACPDAVEVACPICSVSAKPARPRQAKGKTTPKAVGETTTGEIVSEDEAAYIPEPEPQEETPMIQSIAETVKHVVSGLHRNGHHTPEPEPVVVKPLVTDQYEPAPVLVPKTAPLPEAAVSACFTLRLPDNHQLTYTMRGHTDAEVLARIPLVLAGLEKAITPEHGRLSWLRRIFVATFPPRDRDDVSGT